MSAIAELKALANLDSKPFESGASKVKSAAGGMVGSLKGIAGAVGAAFSVAAITSFGKQLMTEAATIKRAADALGVGVGQMDALGDAAAETGASSQGFQEKLVKLADSQEEAVKGNKEAAESFARLGISVDDLTQLSPDKLLERVAMGAQKDATAVSDLNNVMGKGAATEYYSVLQKIAQNGLPAVNAATEESIKRFAEMESQYQRIKDKIGEAFMGAVVGTVKLFGGFKGGQAEDSSGIMAQNKDILRMRGLEEERTKKREAGITKAYDSEKKRIDSIEERKRKGIDSISVDAPKAADSMARFGGMIGNQMPMGGGVLQRQLKELEVIAEYTKEMAKSTEQTNKDLAEYMGD